MDSTQIWRRGPQDWLWKAESEWIPRQSEVADGERSARSA